MIKNFFSKNIENKTYFKSLIEKIKIAFSYILYLFTTCLLYTYFKGDKYKWYSLIFYFEFKMEFIALISIIFTSVFSGYSSVQCIFNYLIHPYCLGGKLMYNILFVFTQISFIIIIIIIYTYLLVNTVDSLKDFLNVKTNKLILICLPKNNTSYTTSSLYKNNTIDDDKESINIKKSYTTKNLIGNVNIDSVFNNKFDEFLHENEDIEKENSYYLNTIQEASASNLNSQALTNPGENKNSIKNINAMNHNLNTSQDILDNSNIETKPTLTYSQINYISNTKEVDYDSLSKNKNLHKEEDNDYNHAIDTWYLANIGKTIQQNSEILYNNKETDTTLVNKSTNSNKIKDCSISNNDNTAKMLKRNTIKRQSKLKCSTFNSKLPPYIDHDFEFSFPTYPVVISFLTKVYCFTIFKNEANNINYEEIKKFILNLIKNLINYKDNKINIYQLRIFTLRQNLYNYFNWVLFYFFGKILGIYSAYKVLITTKNYFLSNYSEINDMLKDELINIIDKILSVSFYILTFENDSLLYTIIEQYFSLVVVGSILIVNIRSFLNTIHFLYTRAISKIDFNNNALETSFMTYCVGMFYITSSILIIFSLPKTYR